MLSMLRTDLLLLTMACFSGIGINSGYSLLDFSPYGGLLEETCQNILAHPDVLQSNMRTFMRKAKEAVNDIEPLISYLNDKVELYNQKRKHDEVILVGSMGNKLFFPEKLHDGSYQIELDILFERSLTDLPIPLSDDQEEGTVNSPRVVLQTDNFDNTLPPGMCFLHIDEIHGELNKTEIETFFKTHPINGKTYMNSYQYLLAIPRKEENVSDTVMGEREIDTHGLVDLPTLFRTFKTNRTKVVIGEREFEYIVMIDKVAAVKIQWPFEARHFANRQRKWPPSSLIEEVIHEGCHLVHRSSNEDGIHNLYEAEWKLTFSTSEQKIALAFSESQRAVFLLIKQIKRQHLDMGLFNNREPVSGLTTYHLKSIFLHVSEKVHPEQWDSEPVECFNTFFKQLMVCLGNNFIPHYFIPYTNILSSAWKHKGGFLSNELISTEKDLPIRTKLIETVRKIVKYPGNYIDGRLLTAVDERHVAESAKKYQSERAMPSVETESQSELSITNPEIDRIQGKRYFDGDDVSDDVEIIYSRQSLTPHSKMLKLEESSQESEQSFTGEEQQVPEKRMKIDL